MFGIIFGLMFFKGVLASLAGPAPNYDMQRILATRNPREASLMNGMVNVVLYFPRYLMIAGITVLALAFCMTRSARRWPSRILNNCCRTCCEYVPVGVVGLLLAGLLAALMSNFAATLNAAPAYIVNDIYKRFFNPDSCGENASALSRIWSIVVLAVGILFGVLTTSITEVMMWIVGGLYGGYVMANVLKWYWWRFNGYGYFWGMMAGILSAMFVPESPVSLASRKCICHVSANTLYLFPIILAISIVGCLLGTFADEAGGRGNAEKILQKCPPGAFWGPIREKVMKEDPSFQPNRDFGARLHQCHRRHRLATHA